MTDFNETNSPLSVCDPKLAPSSLSLRQPPIARVRHDHINIEAAKELISAWGYARTKTKLRMYHFIILWKYSALAQNTDALSTQQWAFSEMQRWLIRNQKSDFYLWSRELDREKEDHTHLLIFIKPDLVEPLKKYIMEKCQFTLGTETQASIKVTGGHECKGAHTDSQQVGLLGYLLKSMDPAVNRDGVSVRDQMYITDKDRRPKTVEGKRSGFSQSLGPAARSRDGWNGYEVCASIIATQFGNKTAKYGSKIGLLH
jgi:hypothetical protein